MVYPENCPCDCTNCKIKNTCPSYWENESKKENNKMQDSKNITMKKWLFMVCAVLVATAFAAGGLILGSHYQKSKDEDRWVYILAEHNDEDVAMCAECGGYFFTDDEAWAHAYQTHHDFRGNGRCIINGEWHDIEER